MYQKQQPKNNFNAKIYSHGKITLPMTVKTDLNVHDGDEVIFIKKDLSWIVTTRNNWILEAQAYFKSLNPKGKPIVDEFIKERRLEALKELE